MKIVVKEQKSNSGVSCLMLLLFWPALIIWWVIKWMFIAAAGIFSGAILGNLFPKD